MTVGHSGIEYLGACVALPVGTDCHLPLPRASSLRIPAGAPQVWGEGGLIPCMQCLGLLIHLSGVGLDRVADKSQELLAWGLALTLPHIPRPPHRLAPEPGPGLARWAAVEPSAEVTRALEGQAPRGAGGPKGAERGLPGRRAGWSAVEPAEGARPASPP